jgi:UDP-glucose:(heptosyl)LPS alpha-1,3-glucosyltransferase
MSKKIAIIIERADTALGGAERSVLELATALSALGLQVDMLAAKGQANGRKVHVLCPESPGRRVNYFVFEKALRKHLAENDYEIVHSVLPFDFADVYQPRGGTYAESILRNAASYRNGFLESYKRLTAFTNLRRGILLRAERKLARRAGGPAIVAISQYVAEQFKRHYDTDSQRIVVIRNGVKTDEPIDPEEAGRLRSRITAESGITEADNAALFLFVANNFRLKGLAPLIKAMSAAACCDMKRKAYLIVAGAGKMEKYRRLAAKLGPHAADKRMVFLGQLSHIRNVLSIIDVAVLPTYYDPSSRFILEALAAGKPVITTRFNGATDSFVDNRHGKVVDSPENVDALTKAICYFTDAGNVRKAAQAIAEDNLKKRISVGRVAGQLMEVYESVLQRKGRK